jgi:hypothetical protein
VSAVGLLAVAALVGLGALARLVWRGWTVGVVLCRYAAGQGSWVFLSRREAGSATLQLGPLCITLVAIPPQRPP